MWKKSFVQKKEIRHTKSHFLYEVRSDLKINFKNIFFLLFRFSNSLTNKLENQSQGWSEKLQGKTNKKRNSILSSNMSIVGVDPPVVVPGSGLKRKVSFQAPRGIKSIQVRQIGSVSRIILELKIFAEFVFQLLQL